MTRRRRSTQTPVPQPQAQVQTRQLETKPPPISSGPSQSRTIWILLLGDPGVGKSSFLRASKGDVAHDYTWDSCGIKSCSAVRGDFETEVKVCDPPDFTNESTSYSEVDGALILFDVTKYQTFVNVREWMNKCKRYGNPDIDKLIVGNKCDLSSLRVVAESTAKHYANQLCASYIEASTTAKINVEEAIGLLVTKIMDRIWPTSTSSGLVTIRSKSAKQGQQEQFLLYEPQTSESGSTWDACVGSEIRPSSADASSKLGPEPLPIGRLPKAEPDEIKPEMIMKVVAEVLIDPQKYEALLESSGDNAQTMLNLLQKVLDYQLITDDLKDSVCAAIKQISLRTGLYPDILTLKGVRFEAEPVACGSFSDIWKGFFGPYPICLKVARVHQSKDVQRLIADYPKETLTFNQLEHQNILPFYGIFGVKDPIGRIGMVTPWMQNGTVHEYLSLNPEAPRLPLIYDMLEGVSYLHSKSVIHGDLRASNVLITSAGSACVADFGLFSVKVQANEVEAPLQLPDGANIRWKAPELMDELQDGSLPSPTFQSDVYSTAIVMYEILVGRTPFHELKRDITVISRVVRGIRPTQPSIRQDLELNDGIWAIMDRLWSGIPAERPTIHHTLASLRQIPPVQLTTTRRLMQNLRADQRKHLTSQVFRVAMRGENHNFSEDEIQYLRKHHLG